MTDPVIIKHPLEECLSFGNLSDLDLRGRDSLDLIMTMIGDLRFRSDSIQGTCARYFLLIDLSVVRNLCISAHINCDKLRDYIRRCDSTEGGESRPVSDDRQTALSFFKEKRPGEGSKDSQVEARLTSDSALGQTELSRANAPRA